MMGQTGTGLNIVVTMPLNEAQKRKLTEKAPEANWQWCEGGWFRGEKEALLFQADIILGNVKVPSQLKEAKRLKWIQLNNAGTEGYAGPGALPEGVLLTNATGAYGPAISEHMLACLLMLWKKLPLYYAHQMEGIWKPEGHVRAIEGCTVLCVGMGDIGSAFAFRMKALGAHTIGIRRRTSDKPDYVDELHTAEALDTLLPRADVIALSLPGNGATKHMFDAHRLSLCKKDACLINVGRGSAVDTEVLCRMLLEGRLGSAALDVTDPEPLPEGHPLWKAPNLILTPHVSGGFSLPETLERIVGICADNLERFLCGEKLYNLVDTETGYASNGRKSV